MSDGVTSGVASGELADWVGRMRSQQSNISGSTSASPSRDTNLDDGVRQYGRETGGAIGSGPAFSPPQRGAALLARYGGQAGPTGTANAGAGDSPVSLASFMGGRSAGPRLGKLAGNGRSAPTEASMIDESRYTAIPKPGMSPSRHGGGTDLASFLKARAGAGESPSSPSGPPSWQRPVSPIKTPVAPSTPSSTISSNPVSAPPAKTIPISLPDPVRPMDRRGASTMKNIATSPIKSTEIASLQESVAPSQSQSDTSAKPASQWTPSKQAVDHRTSPAFAAAGSLTSASKQPSFTPVAKPRVQSIVQQRLQEAKEREAAASSSKTSPLSVKTASFPAADRPRSPSKWATVDTSSPSREQSSGKWTPQYSGNALPGLSKTNSLDTGAQSMRSPSPSKQLSTDNDDRYDRAPVRLPGLGGASSPFGSTAGRASPSKEQAGFFTSASSPAEDKPLEHLTASRARGPIRRTARGAPAAMEASTTPSAAAVDPVEPVVAAPAEVAATPSAAPRSTSGKRIVVLISGSGSNLQALIDATHLSPAGPLSHAQISFVISNRKAAFGLQRAGQSNPPIPSSVLALKTWQNKNPGGTREEYDEVLAKAVLDAEGAATGSHLPPPDLVILAGFMHIVSPQFLRALGHETELPTSEAPSWRPRRAVPIINLHPALPGAFDGAHAIDRAYEAFAKGEINRTGIMVHEVVAEVDRGAPIIVREVPIYEEDSLEDLETRMHTVEHRLIVEGAGIMLERGLSRRSRP